MLKRLTTIALVFGLICVVCGSAFAVNKGGADRQAPPITTRNLHDSDARTFPFGNPNARIGDIPRYSADDDGLLSSEAAAEVTAPELAPECFKTTAYDGAGASGNFFPRVEGAEKIGTRWDLQVYTYAEVLGTDFYVWDYALDDPSRTYSVIVEVWDDGGGLPGNLLHTEVVTWDTGFGGGWVGNNLYPPPGDVFFAVPVPVTGSFFLTLGVGPGQTATEWVEFVTDDAGAALTTA
jgi:hypothetical protein